MIFINLVIFCWWFINFCNMLLVQPPLLFLFGFLLSFCADGGLQLANLSVTLDSHERLRSMALPEGCCARLQESL